MNAAAAANLLQSCLTLCDPRDGSPPGSPVSLGFSGQEHWSGLPFPAPMHDSDKWKKSFSCVQLLVTPWTAAHQAPPSMGFSGQEYWSGVNTYTYILSEEIYLSVFTNIFRTPLLSSSLPIFKLLNSMFEFSFGYSAKSTELKGIYMSLYKPLMVTS